MSTYDPLMPERLTEYGVFDEMRSEDVYDLKNPKDLQDIIKAITSLQNGNSNTAKLRDEYRGWIDSILEPMPNEENAGDWFTRYIDIPNFPLPAPHLKASKLQWKALPDSQIKTWKLNLDFVEGIVGRLLPKWISTAFGSYVRPDMALTVALLNLMAL